MGGRDRNRTFRDYRFPQVTRKGAGERWSNRAPKATTFGVHRTVTDTVRWTAVRYRTSVNRTSVNRDSGIPFSLGLPVGV